MIIGMLSTRRLQTFFSKTENTPKTLPWRFEPALKCHFYTAIIKTVRSVSKVTSPTCYA
jgi:hypothetical protein